VDPVLALGPAVITPVDNPALSPPERVIGDAIADAAPSEAAGSINLKPMLATLTVSLVLVGIGLLTVKRQTRRIALHVRSDKLVRNAVRRLCNTNQSCRFSPKPRYPVSASRCVRQTRSRNSTLGPSRSIRLNNLSCEGMGPSRSIRSSN
jgi:hypothetical protein